MELTPTQLAALERLFAHGFRGAAFPLYASAIAIRKGNCAALLAPVQGGGLQIVGEPSFLVENNLSVQILRERRLWFVWKKKQIEATPERLAELARFKEDLSQALLSTV
jgi:hypothetical protein